MSGPKDGSTFNFEHKRRSLIEYLKVKMDEGDWHGVSDAANDLRVLEATMDDVLRIEVTPIDGINNEIYDKLNQLHTEKPIGRAR